MPGPWLTVENLAGLPRRSPASARYVLSRPPRIVQCPPTMTPLLPLVSLLLSADAPSLVDQRPSIHVTGLARTSVAPDKVDLNLTVQSEADTVDGSMLANESKLKASTAAARALGVPAADIQLSSVGVSTREEY